MCFARSRIWIRCLYYTTPVDATRNYSRKKGHACNFSEKGQKKGKKGQNIWKFGQNCTQFENILKKASLMRATITCIKQLEYALATWEHSKRVLLFWSFVIVVNTLWCLIVLTFLANWENINFLHHSMPIVSFYTHWKHMFWGYIIVPMEWKLMILTGKSCYIQFSTGMAGWLLLTFWYVLTAPSSKFYGKIWVGFCLNTGKHFFLEAAF